MTILSVNNLSKKYKTNDFYSLKDVNFDLNEGEIVGLIGRNGAGKSTLLKLISKAIVPNEGTIEYKGKNIFEGDNILDDFGILIETVFVPHITVLENLKFYLAIHNKTEYEKDIEEVLTLLDIYNRKDDYPKNFSFGMKQRLALSIALITKPEILLLDEPFVGLDPLGVRKLIDILQNWAKNKNVTMLISSHQLGELDSFCERFIYIEDGRLKKEIEKESENSVIIKLQNPPDSEIVSEFEGVRIEENSLIVKDMDKVEFTKLLGRLAQNNVISDIVHPKDELSKYFK